MKHILLFLAAASLAIAQSFPVKTNAGGAVTEPANLLISGALGGTGVANTGKTVTLGGNLTTSGAFGLVLTLTGNTTVTLPTSGTLSTLAGVEVFTNKSINLANNTLTATSAQVATSVTDETGTGNLVFSTSPTLVTPNIGAATGTSVNLSGNGTFGGNLTVGGSANLTSSSLNSYIYDGTGWVWTSTGTSGGTVKGGIYAAGGLLSLTANSSLATNRFSLNSSGDATIAGSLTVSGGTIGTAASTNLTLNGGSSGASLALGQGTTGTFTFTLPSINAGSTTWVSAGASGIGIDFKRATATATLGGTLASLNGYNGATRSTIFEFNGDGATDSGRFDWWVKPTAGSLTQAMVLKSTGNLLLGTTTDTGEKLQVNGTGYFAGALLQLGNGSNDALYRVSASNGKSSDFGDDTTGGFVRANNSQSLRFITAGNIVLTLDSSANATFAGKITAAGAIVTTGSVANMLEVTSSSTNATNFNLINSSTGAATWSIGSAGSASGTGDAAGTLYFYQGSGTKFSLEKTTGNATLAGNLTVSGSIVNQNGVIQSTLAAGALISSLSTNNNAVHGFQISGSGTGSRDWRLEQGRAGANSFSISNATGGLTTPLIVNGATNNILIGCSSTSSDSGNGKLQLADHTSSTGGIGFGSDVALFRAGGNTLRLNLGVSAAALWFDNGGNGTGGARILGSSGALTITSNGANSLFLQTGGTTALTLDSSQNAIFSATTDSTSTSTGALQVSGGVGIAKTLTTTGRILTTTVKTANYTVATTDHVVVCNSASTFTVTLIAASTNTGRHFIVKNKGAGTVTVDATSLGQIDGVNTITLGQYQSTTLVSDGTTWNRI